MELASLGCSEAQGWLYGRAVSADTVRSFLDGETGEADQLAEEDFTQQRRGAKF